MLKLKELRAKNRISQQKLANHLNVSRSTVAMWETGSSSPDTEILSKIADYFGVSVDYLLDRKTPDTQDPKVEKKDIMVALFGGEQEVTNEMWEEALFAVELIKQRHNKKKETDEGPNQDSKT